MTDHIYPGAKYDTKGKDNFLPASNVDFFGLLREFKDSIIVEGCAHDHYADVRYHSDATVSPKVFYHSLIVAPGVTPIDGQNPGIATFEIDTDTMKAKNLVFQFI